MLPSGASGAFTSRRPHAVAASIERVGRVDHGRCPRAEVGQEDERSTRIVPGSRRSGEADPAGLGSETSTRNRHPRPAVTGRITDRVAATYRGIIPWRHLAGPARPPRFVINATNVQSGALWRFMKPYIARLPGRQVDAPKLPWRSRSRPRRPSAVALAGRMRLDPPRSADSGPLQRRRSPRR